MGVLSSSRRQRMQSLPIKSGQGDYVVEFLDDLRQIAEQIATLPNAAIVIDRNVATLYADVLQPVLQNKPTLVIDATEEEKSLRGVGRALDFFQASNCVKASLVVAIGGGITQDIVAFAAHMYYRGLKWVFVPTTLLAMADSCIGAKCGVNLNEYKNQLGVFYSPSRVLVCIKFLETLSETDVRSGYGEIFKLSLTGSTEFFNAFMEHVNRDGFRRSNIETMIYDSLCVKKQVIEQDEYEIDLRRILNYGHTFGHALEAITHYAVPHGQAVVWGLNLVNWIAQRQGLLSKSDFDLIHSFIQQNFAIRFERPVSAAELIQGARRDKKVSGSRVNLVLLERPGSLKIVPTVFDDHLDQWVTEYLKLNHV
ncbi:iron-containing alcohol dehydrogenase [bacterium]|nr:MAG: iron-containing alcohol dehydrogenase [bacterium]